MNGRLLFVNLLQTPHTNRIAMAVTRQLLAAAFAALIVVIHGTRYATAARRIAFSSLNECAPVAV